MKQIQVHFHLAYVLNGRFQLTVQSMDKPNHPMVEVMTVGDLRKSIRAMKPGSKSIRIGKQTIKANVGLPLDGVRAYFKKVYDGYMRAKANGRDLDAELRKLGNPDPTDGSGGFSLN